MLVDDITHPDDEKRNCLSINAKDEYVSKTEEDYGKEQLKPSQQAGGLILPVHENSLLVEASVSKAEKGGKTIPVVYCHLDADRFLVLLLPCYFLHTIKIIVHMSPYLLSLHQSLSCWLLPCSTDFSELIVEVVMFLHTSFKTFYLQAPRLLHSMPP